MTTSDGFFSRSLYLKPGDAEAKRRQEDEKGKRPAFRTSGSHSGNGPDAYFGKLSVLCDGDKFLDAPSADRRERADAAKKRLTPNGFAYASKTTRGPIPGMLGEYPKHEADFSVQPRGAPTERKTTTAPPNMKTTPPSRGIIASWGAAAAKDYKRDPDPYGGDPEKIAALRGAPPKPGKEEEKRAPFRSMVRRAGGAFDALGATGVSAVYAADAGATARSVRTPPPSGGGKGDDEGKKRAVWMPGGAHKAGRWQQMAGGLFEYGGLAGAGSPTKADEEPPKPKADAEDGRPAHWRPVSGPKSTLQRSIACHPAQLRKRR